jgi:hypothetical protein
LALAKAGKSIPAKMAMMAITTNSSIKVKALWLETSTESEGLVFMGCNSRGIANDVSDHGIRFHENLRI